LTFPGWRTDSGVCVERPLLPQAKMTGSCLTTAKFSVSWKMPSSQTPSPKKGTAARGRPSILKDQAEPTAVAIVSPRMADDATWPPSGAFRWTEPPRPLQQPSMRPYSSAIMPRRLPPLARYSAWQRWPL